MADLHAKNLLTTQPNYLRNSLARHHDVLSFIPPR